MASQACGQTRAELNALLRECGFGRDADMFACYFLRKDRLDAAGRQETVIVCAACGLTVGEHDERDAEPVVVGTAMVETQLVSKRQCTEPVLRMPDAVLSTPMLSAVSHPAAGGQRASSPAPPPGLARRTG